MNFRVIKIVGYVKKNPQFSPIHTNIIATKPTLEVDILTKFHNDKIKSADFLLLSNFEANLKLIALLFLPCGCSESKNPKIFCNVKVLPHPWPLACLLNESAICWSAYHN